MKYHFFRNGCIVPDAYILTALDLNQDSSVCPREGRLPDAKKGNYCYYCFYLSMFSCYLKQLIKMWSKKLYGQWPYGHIKCSCIDYFLHPSTHVHMSYSWHLILFTVWDGISGIPSSAVFWLYSTNLLMYSFYMHFSSEIGGLTTLTFTYHPYTSPFTRYSYYCMLIYVSYVICSCTRAVFLSLYDQSSRSTCCTLQSHPSDWDMYLYYFFVSRRTTSEGHLLSNGLNRQRYCSTIWGP